MPTQRDYYEVLGVTRDADSRTIKTAYRRLAVQYHPDKNPGDQSAEEKFKEAADAYAVLSDDQKRARYDRFGHEGVGDIGGAAGFDPDVFGDFADILGDLFGFRRFSLLDLRNLRRGGGSRLGRRRNDIDVDRVIRRFGQPTRLPDRRETQEKTGNGEVEDNGKGQRGAVQPGWPFCSEAP